MVARQKSHIVSLNDAKALLKRAMTIPPGQLERELKAAERRAIFRHQAEIAASYVTENTADPDAVGWLDDIDCSAHTAMLNAEASTHAATQPNRKVGQASRIVERMTRLAARGAQAQFAK